MSNAGGIKVILDAYLLLKHLYILQYPITFLHIISRSFKMFKYARLHMKVCTKKKKCKCHKRESTQKFYEDAL